MRPIVISSLYGVDYAYKLLHSYLIIGNRLLYEELLAKWLRHNATELNRICAWDTKLALWVSRRVSTPWVATK